MFIRTRVRENGKTQIQIVESVRHGSKISQKILRNVGLAGTDREIEQFTAIAEAAIVEMKNNQKPVLAFQDPFEVHAPKRKKGEKKDTCEDQIKIKNIRHEKSINDGNRELFGEIYDEIGLNNILDVKYKAQQWNNMLRDVCISRITEPNSKRQTHRQLQEQDEVNYSLDSVYRLMDHVSKNEQRIKSRVCSSTMELLQNKVDVLFYDVTTLYFESTRNDDLRNFGFSKDCKFKEVQVVLALVTTNQGLPLTYKLFPGNTNEGKTLIPVITELKKEFDINRVVMAADRAMFTEENLTELEKNGIQYVVAAKLRGMSKQKKAEILDSRNYGSLNVGSESLWVGEFLHHGRRLISTLSYKRAEKDAKDRQRLIERLQKKEKQGSINLTNIIPNHGTKKYLKITAGKAELNHQKIENDAEWDGIHGVITNDFAASVSEILSWYRGLWQIEEAFRINKHTLEMRPIYHWNKSRIEAHVLICFMSFAILKQTLVRLKNKKIEISPQELIYQMRSVELHRFQDIASGKRYFMPSLLNTQQKKIFSALGIKRPHETHPC